MSSSATRDRLSRVTLNPEQCGGRPCIRGTRIRVSDVLGLLAAGLSPAEVLEELLDLVLDLEAEDIGRVSGRGIQIPRAETDVANIVQVNQSRLLAVRRG